MFVLWGLRCFWGGSDGSVDWDVEFLRPEDRTSLPAIEAELGQPSKPPRGDSYRQLLISARPRVRFISVPAGPWRSPNIPPLLGSSRRQTLEDKVYCQSFWNLVLNQSTALFRHWPPGSAHTHTHWVCWLGLQYVLWHFGIWPSNFCFQDSVPQGFDNASDRTMALTGLKSVSLWVNMVHAGKFVRKLAVFQIEASITCGVWKSWWWWESNYPVVLWET